ncbi:MAG: tRNA uridine-5-carboxymethylaminomethyl(34) synthesis GTPase MnmE [Vulcanimicrobiaceae bacterium]
MVALATPPGSGAIAIVRCSGPGVVALAGRILRTSRPLRPHVAAYVTILDEQARPLDRGIALYAQAPHSYTGEDTLECHIHGSPVIARELLRAMIACGARLATPGEFTRRAFLNGKIGLHEADAVAQLIAAESRSAARAALANLGGGLTSEVAAIRTALRRALEALAASIDYPDEVPEPDRAALLAQLASAVQRLERLRQDGEVGRLMREGVGVAIVGPPNAGKSSLLNALLGEERALVSDLPGTTRDTIEESIAILGVAVRLIDTAGIRTHADRVEAAGIERTRRALESARVALIVLDGSAAMDEQATGLLEQTAQRPRIVFCNKADLGVDGAAAIAALGPLVGSVHQRASLDALRAAIADVGLGGGAPDLERPHLASAAEFAAVNAGLESLERARITLLRGEPVDFVTVELQRCVAQLGSMTGEAATEELLDGIFARFCIGK